MILERRQTWPAVAIMGVGILSLAITLKAAQADMPIPAPWVMGALAGLYVVLALLAEGFRWQSLLVLAAMLAAHAFMALLMGWGYAAVEGHPRTFVPALQHGLWEYLPGTALQFGFACLMGIVLDAWLEPVPLTEGEACEPEAAPRAAPAALLDLPDAAGLAAMLEAAVSLPGVAAALAAAETVQSAGVWARDPEAAWQRVRALITAGGTGLHSVPLQDASLLTRSEEGRAAALLVTAALDQPTEHDLLRQLWAAAEREWGPTA